ncbi:hypothetical protein JCM8547_007700 [Rhodosporidiobolus lusitaniae]
MDLTDFASGDLGVPSAGPHLPPPSSTSSAPLSTDRPQLNPKRATLTRKLSFPDPDTAPLDPLLLARLRRYILTFALVEFDIDQGPNLDNAFPPVRFPPDVKSNIAFSSLPEGDLPSFSPVASTSTASPPAPGENGYAYHWQIPYPSEGDLRRAEQADWEKARSEGRANGAVNGKGKGKEVFRLPEGDEGDGALHGFVWFVQEKDDRLRRGYSQQSLITHLPSLSGLFSSLLTILGPLHFKHAQTAGAKGGMVESACYNIASWPDPTPGTTLELPFLGSVLTVSLPLPSQAQFPPPPPPGSSSASSMSPRGARRAFTHPPPSSQPPSPFLSAAAWTPSPSSTLPPPVLPASLPLTPLCVLLFPPYSGSPGGGGGGKIGPIGFTKLLLLWELVLLGESLLVFSNEPRVGAEVVEHLTRLVRPVKFAGDARPYAHVHDRDFGRLCKADGKPPPATLLASTNPLVLRNCKAWPHILRLDRASSPQSSSSASSSSLRPPPHAKSGALGRSASVGARPGSTSAGGGGLGGDNGGKEFGLKSQRKRHVKKDEEVGRRVEEAWGRGEYLACDLLLYQHFASLTERFLAPLNRYFGTLWAGSGGLGLGMNGAMGDGEGLRIEGMNGSASSATAPPLLSPGPAPLPSTRFSPTSFLTSLRAHGSSLPLKPSSFPSFSQPSTTPIERFYLRFLSRENPNAREWEKQRTRDVGGEVRRRYLVRLGEVDVERWAEGKGVEEVGELVERLEREAGRLSLAHGSSSSTTTPRATPVPPPSFSSLAPPTTNAGLGITSSSPTLSSSTSFSRAPSPSSSPTPPSSFSADAPAGAQRLLKQAERLRSLRDERVRSGTSSVYSGGGGGGSTAGSSSAGSLSASVGG